MSVFIPSRLRVLLGAALCAALAATASAETVVLQNGATVGKGAYNGALTLQIKKANPNQKANNATINVGRLDDNPSRGLVAFDLSALPRNAVIQSVSLSLTGLNNDGKSSAKAVDVYLHGTTQTIGQGFNTWDNTADTLWSSGGAAPTILATTQANPKTDSGTTMTFDSSADFVTFVQKALASNNQRLNLMLKLSDALEDGSSRHFFRLNTSEAGGSGPVLTINYTLGR